MIKQKTHPIEADHVFLPLVVLFAQTGRPYGPVAPYYGTRLGYRPGYGPYARPWPYRSW